MQWIWPCRYCANLVNVAPPRAKYIGKCRYNLNPKTCTRFALADCCRGSKDKYVKAVVRQMAALKAAKTRRKKSRAKR